MPGFVDITIHPAQPYLLEEAGALLFPESSSREQIAEAVPLPEEKPGRAVRHRREWALPLFPTARPDKGWVDSLVRDRPASSATPRARCGREHGDAEARRHHRDTPQPRNGLSRRTLEPASRRVFARRPAGRLQQAPLYRTRSGNAPCCAPCRTDRLGVTAYTDASAERPAVQRPTGSWSARVAELPRLRVITNEHWARTSGDPEHSWPWPTSTAHPLRPD